MNVAPAKLTLNPVNVIEGVSLLGINKIPLRLTRIEPTCRLYCFRAARRCLMAPGISRQQ